MHERKAAIDLWRLPKTIQDAVEVSRKLKVKYIWVDALCICQDDNDEWARESAKMASIYSNAYVTIAAAGAEDVNSGCFLERSKNVCGV